ncbi:MAG: bifunctional 2-polyprenyl-6-hydroxyphenol methylase/3-demethylubiquinol 3-O-methyltransferase UbiG [Sphingobacteriia bacterium]|nr:bifunctional 2-polyprenyl-6-hydroxyphenol methylase/3-demethylubiquinol 3-O-methyltransferase UbiG [Sphingobacteriia bacterium]NCC40754.1 bifunctional 2-polyprenyl-6-hydroxyphenol methylase/3-demethylubiquinol 3-O-methyltransferase UbiG [Gammaproteobacteria bacterium]
MPPEHPRSTTIDPQEVAYFERLAHRWWDERGPFWPLHRLNAFRVEDIRRHLGAAFARDPAAAQPLAGLRILDIGCGGGILSEAIARLGATVTGIDIVEKNIAVARLHAEWSGLTIDYRLAPVETLVRAGEQFDVVLNMEVVEHVEQRDRFIVACGRLVRPGGSLFIATINRTIPAYLIAIIGAESILRWLPKGTHQYRKLVRPAEIKAALGDDFVLEGQTGVRVNPFDRSFHYTPWMAVNYMMRMRRR